MYLLVFRPKRRASLYWHRRRLLQDRSWEEIRAFLPGQGSAQAAALTALLERLS
ncbi:MAG: hypothetical protein OWV35_04230 [Firmicutes bacterium]|nr:hypothetical protein [Bacillota bacterium]